MNASAVPLRICSSIAGAASGLGSSELVGDRSTRRAARSVSANRRSVPASELAADRDLAFTAELRCAIEVALLDADEADRVSGEDANGKPAMLVQSHRNATSFLGSVPLHDGRSGTFFVGESAVRLLLQRGDRTVRTIAIQPDPARTTSVQ